MNNIEYINKLFIKNNGILKTSQLTDNNIPRQYLKLMLQKRKIIKVTRGFYILNNNLEDELYIYQQRYNKGIFSHETALYIHNFTDRMLDKYIMTFPQGYHITSYNKEIITIKQANSNIYKLGIEEKKSPYNNNIKVYNIEKTLCDIIRGNNINDIQLVIRAIKKYVLQKNKNIPLLIEYATKLKVKNKILKYLQVLL
ncbi:MAG: type IV toxin-antitoxin system AbiEi family antitoxin domain-containing protein [Endomicrobiaceae bacterium]